MKILLVVSSSDFGGGQSAVLALARGLKSLGVGVFSAISGAGPLSDPLRRASVGSIELPMNGLTRLDSVIRLAAFIGEVRPDVVHSHLWNADWFAAAATVASGRFPGLVSTVHGSYYLPLPSQELGIAWKSAVYRAVYWPFDVVVAVSHNTRRDLESRTGVSVSGAKIRVIPPPVSRTIQSDSAGRASESRRAWIVSNFYPIKGHDWFIRCLPRATALLPGVQFHFVGDGPARGEMERLSSRLGVAAATIFHGAVPNPFSRINRGDVLILPSLSEGIPIVVLEAFDRGVPVVASRVGGIEEVIHDGVTGSTFALGDVDGMVAGVRRAFVDSEFRGRTVMAAKSLVRDRYDRGRVARAHLALYNEVVETRGIRVS